MDKALKRSFPFYLADIVSLAGDLDFDFNCSLYYLAFYAALFFKDWVGLKVSVALWLIEGETVILGTGGGVFIL